MAKKAIAKSEFKLLSHLDVEYEIENGADGLLLSLLKWQYICEALKTSKYVGDREALVYNSRETCGLCYKYIKCDNCVFGYPCYLKGPIKEAVDSIYDWRIKPTKKNQKTAIKKSINVLFELTKYTSDIEKSRIDIGNVINVNFSKRAKK